MSLVLHQTDHSFINLDFSLVKLISDLFFKGVLLSYFLTFNEGFRQDFLLQLFSHSLFKSPHVVWPALPVDSWIIFRQVDLSIEPLSAVLVDLQNIFENASCGPIAHHRERHVVMKLLNYFPKFLELSVVKCGCN